MLHPERLDDTNTEKYLILKAASVIGLNFDSETLLKINPFKEIISEERLIKNLYELVKERLLEILDEGEGGSRITYRFTLPFFRELIY